MDVRFTRKHFTLVYCCTVYAYHCHPLYNQCMRRKKWNLRPNQLRGSHHSGGIKCKPGNCLSSIKQPMQVRLRGFNSRKLIKCRLTPFCLHSRTIRSHNKLADSLSSSSSFLKHSVALFWEKVMTSTLWVSSLKQNQIEPSTFKLHSAQQLFNQEQCRKFKEYS